MKRTLFAACVSALMLMLAFTSCNEQKHKGYTKTESGVYYKYIVENEGQTPNVGDVVSIDFAYYAPLENGGDTLLFVSKDAVKDEFVDNVQNSLFVGDYYEAIRMMHKGDSMSVYLNVDSVFTKMFGVPYMPDFIKKGGDMRWEIKLLDFCTEEEYLAGKENEADELFKKYLTENEITTEPTESGLIYVCTQPGDGLHPQAGNNVQVHYTGTLLNGEKFDSSYDREEPFKFMLGQGQVIKGWDEGIALMSKGEKGVLYIPQNLAYGSRKIDVIPAFSNLVFEVELVDFE